MYFQLIICYNIYMSIIVKYILMLIALLVGDFFLSGIRVLGTDELYQALRVLDFNNIFVFENWRNLLIIAFILFIIQFVIMPILRFITFPINFLTLGIFYFLLSISSIKALSYLTGDFIIESWTSLIIFSVIVSFFVTISKPADEE